jgi:hypothetical protein
LGFLPDINKPPVNPYSDNWLHFHWRIQHGPYEGREFVISDGELNTVLL